MHAADTLQSTSSLQQYQLSAADFPDKHWWTQLGDAQLDALINEALHSNPSLALADARIRQAQAQAGLVDAIGAPALSASARGSVAQLPETMAPSPIGGELKHSGVLMLNFSWTPDIWGGQRANYDAAVGEVHATEIDAQAARLSLTSSIVSSYLALASAYESLELAQRELARSQRLSTLSKQRVDAGIDNELQLHQSDSTEASARQLIQSTQQQIETLNNALAALTGQGPDRGLHIKPPHITHNAIAGVPSTLPSDLLGHRPDVVAARWRVESASRHVDASKASFKPSVNLTALAGLVAPGLSDLFSSKAAFGLGGPAISLPIFDGGRLRNTLADSDARYDMAVANYNQTLVNALREVTDAVQSARALDEQIVTTQQAADSARKAWKVADMRYEAGLATQLDVLASQRPLLQLEQKILELQHQRNVRFVNLNNALGGGLDIHAPNDSISKL